MPVACLLDPLCDAVLEALPCEIIVHDEHSVVLANAAACRLFGAPSPRSLVGLPLSALVHPDDQKAGEHRRARMFGEGRCFSSVPVKISTLSGEETTVEVTARSFSVGHRAYAFVTRCVCCESIVESPECVRSFPEGTPIAEAVLDALPQPITAYDAHDRFVYANSAASRIFGAVRSGGLAGQPVSVIVHPHASEAARQRRRLVIDQGQTFQRVEAKLRTIGGDVLLAVGSLGSAKLPDGGRIGYWMGHSVDRNSRPSSD